MSSTTLLRRPNGACSPRVRSSALVAAAVTSALLAPAARAQDVASQARRPESLVLTLDDALRLGEENSEQLRIANAVVARARGVEAVARSERLPQLFASASYDRTIASEFSGLFDSADSTCTPLQADASASVEDRVAELERAYSCPSSSGSFTGEGVDLPFGRPNAYRVGLAFTQAVYAGGRIAAQEQQARLGVRNAQGSLTSTRAQLALDVARAYLDAAVADRLVTIAESSYEQADRAFQQTKLQWEAGRQSEFELLRAQVARDTLQPQVIRAKVTRDIAYMQLRQLLEIPAAVRLELAAVLDGDAPPAERYRAAVAEVEAGVTPQGRVGVDIAANDVVARQAGVAIARSQRLPSIGLNSTYGVVSYPSGFNGFDDWRTNWTVGAAVQVPIFTGGRLRADEAIARADLEESQQRLVLARELASLDEETARQELVAARAAWEASAGTVQQAQRAYEIADLRYNEGLSTQLELSDARLLLQQAQVNRAQAARDLQIARVRLVLLPELPLTTPGASGALAQGQRTTTALQVTAASTPSTAASSAATARTTLGAQR